jgi:guanylate kinase
MWLELQTNLYKKRQNGENMKKILILAGPSGVGKTTLAHALLKSSDRFELVRSVTSRSPRGDAYDAEYIYLSRDEMQRLIADGGVLEHTEYAGNLYGTPRSEIDRISAEGRTPLLILDLNGVHTVVNSTSDISSCAIYVSVPDSVLLERLSARYGTDSEKLNSRLEKNVLERAYFEEIKRDFFAVVENSGSVNECTDKILEVFNGFCDK